MNTTQSTETERDARQEAFRAYLGSRYPALTATQIKAVVQLVETTLQAREEANRGGA